MPASQGEDSPAAPPRRRLVVFYVVLAALTAAVTSVVLVVGADREAQPDVAGGFDVSAGAECLGPRFDLTQSGTFVGFQNVDDTLSGSLDLEDGRLDGEVRCVDGESLQVDARVAEGRIEGTLGGGEIAAVQRREPPLPGARRPRVPSNVAGEYRLIPESECLGGRVGLEGDGAELGLLSGERHAGKLRYGDGKLSGDVKCKDGGKARLAGTAVDRELRLELTEAGETDRVTAAKTREFGETLAVFFMAIAAVMLAARLVGWLFTRASQPRVMGEVVAGILLGPTVFGALLPELQGALFPQDIIPVIGIVANLGLIFYMFLVGLEIDFAQLRGRIGQAAAISNASVALPMALGITVALPIFELLGPETEFVSFALFMGVAMSITAFPVLARILVDRRMLKRPVGALTLACAAIDDVTAWFLIALATAVAVAGGSTDVIVTVALALGFCLVMGFGVRPLIGRVSTAYDEAGRVPGGWIAAIFAGVLLSAYVTETIGIALIFGAFVMGIIMPRHAELTEDVTGRIEDFVITLLLPLFFAFTGLRTNVGLLDRPELWLLTLALIAVAIVGKLFGAMLAARVTGFGWQASAVIGTLMNTRGLTELIVLNLALEKGVISEALFAMLVIMALVTTFMAAPLLRLIDPQNRFGAPLEDDLEAARQESLHEFPQLTRPERSILVAPQADNGLERLRLLAEPLARSEPPRELILAQLVLPPRGAAIRGGLQTENRLLEEATREVTAARNELAQRGIAARGVAFSSADPGADLARLAEREEVDLMLADGQRSLLGDGVPRGSIGRALEEVPCDVAVLVAPQEGELRIGPEHPVLVPFGGAQHDWAALELSAWIASVMGAPLRLLGAADGEPARVTRMLADASLMIQHYAGISAEPLLVEPGREAVLEASAEAGLLVIGLSERWRQEGLGATRAEIARLAPSPVLFVRRGTRPGALAPRSDVTRFTWSSPGAAGLRLP